MVQTIRDSADEDGMNGTGNLESGRRDSRSSEPTVKRGRCAVNKETLPLKITQFFYYGAMAAILPYLTVHMQDIGISIQEVAIIYAVLPFTSFLGPPLMGFLADKLGEYKWVLIFGTFFNGFFHTSLLFVPQFRPEMLLTEHGMLHWNSRTNEAFLSPGLTGHCPEFTNFTEARNSIEIVKLNDCLLLADNSAESRSFSVNDKGQPNFMDFIHTISGATGIQDFENSTLLNSFGVEESEPKNHPNSGNFVLHFEERQNCSIRVSNPYLRKDWINSSEIKCKTDMAYGIGMREQVGSNAQTFWIYFLIRIFATICLSSCFSLLDATVLAVVKKVKSAEYGKERVWSIVGLALSSPIAGILVDRVSRVKNYTDYAPAFYLSNALLVCNIIAYFLIKLDVEKPEKGVMRNGLQLLKYPEVVVFLVMIFILGAIWGFVESYLFVFLKELEAPNYLLGLTLTVGSLVGLPFLWVSERIVAVVGRVNLIILAFFTYFVRFFGYSYLQNPFWCFPFEAMEAFTYHLMWTAAATYCGVLAPKGLLASMTGVMGSLHYGLGKGAGSFLGGYLYGAVGARHTFRFFGIAAGICGIIFIILNFFWISKVVERRTKEKLEDEKLEEEQDKVMQSLQKGDQSHSMSVPNIAGDSDSEESGLMRRASRDRIRERRSSHVLLSSSYTSQSPVDYS